jgi:hypothetical protein
LQKVGAARRAARDRATRRVAPTIGFARLASGAFYKTIVLLSFYEIINLAQTQFIPFYRFCGQKQTKRCGSADKILAFQRAYG